MVIVCWNANSSETNFTTMDHISQAKINAAYEIRPVKIVDKK